MVFHTGGDPELCGVISDFLTGIDDESQVFFKLIIGCLFFCTPCDVMTHEFHAERGSDFDLFFETFHFFFLMFDGIFTFCGEKVCADGITGKIDTGIGSRFFDLFDPGIVGRFKRSDCTGADFHVFAADGFDEFDCAEYVQFAVVDCTAQAVRTDTDLHNNYSFKRFFVL